ncbi:MAG: hypothetical protein KC636_24135, partial [Myxococcales bacterium]|nr:hypothetical protein [Myxococcales bacterium]
DPSMSGTDSSDSDPSDSDSDSDTGHTTGDPCEEMGDNLVDNGSFEIPVVMSPAHWDIYTDAEIPGWHMKWLNGGACDPDDPVTEPVVELQQNLHAIAVDGIQYAELDSDCQGPAHNANTDEETTIRLFQEIDTSVGAKFEIRFWARARPNVPGAQLITATFGSAQLLTDVPAPASWTEYVFVVEIDADITTIAFADTGVPNSLGVFLDHVQVYAIDAQCP